MTHIRENIKSNLKSGSGGRNVTNTSSISLKSGSGGNNGSGCNVTNI